MTSMGLLTGDQARTAVAELLSGNALVAIEVDPPARHGAKPRVVAIATLDRAVLVEAAALALLSQADRAFGAFEAKAVHRALFRSGAAPGRWACVRLCEQLLLGGRDLPLTLEAIAGRYGMSAPPPAEAGLVELGERARAVARLVGAQGAAIKRDGLSRVSRLEASAVAAIGELEERGMPFDAVGWRSISTEIERERAERRKELVALLASPKDKNLFGESTLSLDNDHELKRLLHAAGHPVPDVRRATVAELPPPLGPKLARYRELTKLVTAYGESFLEHVGADGRLHPTFEQIGASTGRMACHAPNLQSIVKDAPHRRCFRAPEGKKLVIGDYATCELRILAEMSGDPVFAEAFARNEDLHSRVASRVFGKPVSKSENPELRERAKAVSFGLVYGMGAAGLARATDTDQATAEQLLARYFASFPRIKGFLEHTSSDAMSRGHAQTMTGRRLYLDPGPDRSSRSQAERIAKNMPIQGTSADITKIALARLRTALAPVPAAWLVNTVHDEIVVECGVADAGAVEKVVRDEMRLAGEEVLRSVPVAVDVAVSDHWKK
jgi:DNA polymerase I